MEGKDDRDGGHGARRRAESSATLPRGGPPVHPPPLPPPPLGRAEQSRGGEATAVGTRLTVTHAADGPQHRRDADPRLVKRGTLEAYVALGDPAPNILMSRSVCGPVLRLSFRRGVPPAPTVTCADSSASFPLTVVICFSK